MCKWSAWSRVITLVLDICGLDPDVFFEVLQAGVEPKLIKLSSQLLGKTPERFPFEQVAHCADVGVAGSLDGVIEQDLSSLEVVVLDGCAGRLIETTNLLETIKTLELVIQRSTQDRCTGKENDRCTSNPAAITPEPPAHPADNGLACVAERKIVGDRTQISRQFAGFLIAVVGIGFKTAADDSLQRRGNVRGSR